MKLLAYWVDLTVSTKRAELPAPFYAQCDIERIDNLEMLRGYLEKARPDVVVFDFDYPPRRTLRTITDIKGAFPRVPMVMLTVQHSEALAIWSFRSKLFDVLVKPIPTRELDNCLRALREIKGAMELQSPREMKKVQQHLPTDIMSAMVEDEIALQPAISFVEKNYYTSFGNDFVAELCGMNPFRFSRSFKQTFGIGFHEYVVRYRLREARRLLATPNARVTEVCYAVGFNDSSYFTRVFKKYFAESPSSVRGVPLRAPYASQLTLKYPPVPHEDKND